MRERSHPISLTHDAIATILLSEGRMSLTELRERYFWLTGRFMSETALSARCRETKYCTEYTIMAHRCERWVRRPVKAGESTEEGT